MLMRPSVFLGVVLATALGAGSTFAEIDHVVLEEPIAVMPGFTQQLEMDGFPLFDPELGGTPPWDVFVNHWFAPDFSTYYSVAIRGFPGTVVLNGTVEEVTYFAGTSSEQTETYPMVSKLENGDAISPLTVGTIGTDFRGTLALRGEQTGEFYVPDGESLTAKIGVSFQGENDAFGNRMLRYGWIEFQINTPPTGNGLGEFIITQWAYETEHGRPLLAGETATSLQRGDFDASSSLGLSDLQYMASIIGNDPLGEDDFNVDGDITVEDALLWVTDAYGTFGGDANLDFSVDLIDLSTLASNFGTASGAFWDQGDFNLDGAVDLIDLSTLASNFGSTAAAPEPAGATLLGLGLLAMLRRSA
ncbi:MAG: hypothetical protein RLN76_11535 [Phycisphaeraceae bacterium]